jgi:hypothetical protein
MSSFPLRDRSAGAALARLLLWAALAALVRCGLGAASIVLEIRRGHQDGFTAASALELAGFLPALVVLLAFVHLAWAIDSPRLHRSSVWTCVFGWVAELLRSIPRSVTSEEVEVLHGLLIGVSLLVALGLGIWFDLTLLKLREKLGGLAALLGGAGLVYTAVWVIMKVILVVGLADAAAGATTETEMDQAFAKVGPLHRIDLMVTLGGRVLTSLLTFCLFLAWRERQTSPEQV